MKIKISAAGLEITTPLNTAPGYKDQSKMSVQNLKKNIKINHHSKDWQPGVENCLEEVLYVTLSISGEVQSTFWWFAAKVLK